MKNPDDKNISRRTDPGLLSLAFDCNEMVSQLNTGLKLEFQGEHQSAMEELDLVRNQIDSWLDKLEGVESSELDKEQIVGNLKEAKHAVNLD
ncbi:hypothetical protein KGY79_10870 [Candidatus Bipolaricaulota bacterium]|nr:hypothetical protein [Candidatus Bipolaricaulota bacterium]